MNSLVNTLCDMLRQSRCTFANTKEPGALIKATVDFLRLNRELIDTTEGIEHYEIVSNNVVRYKSRAQWFSTLDSWDGVVNRGPNIIYFTKNCTGCSQKFDVPVSAAGPTSCQYCEEK